MNAASVHIRNATIYFLHDSPISRLKKIKDKFNRE